MMQLGICGWHQSGKSTVFDVLTGGEAHDHARDRAKVGVAHVRDERVDFLARMFNPKKITYAAVEYVDLPGLEAGPRAHEVNPSTLADVRQTEGLIAVVRAFEAPTVMHPLGSVDPARDFSRLWDELIFADLEMASRRIERLEKDLAKPSPHSEQNKLELSVLQRMVPALEEGKGADSVEMSEAEEKAVRGFRFLTAKPILILINAGEEVLDGERRWSEEEFHRPSVEMFAKLELELDELAEEERPAFMEELGLEHLAAEDVVKKCYEMLDMISFLTGGDKECRAWTIRRGTTAVEAAGTVHSDMERGFIRAQVTAIEDLKALGSFKEARAHGKLRLEGRDYVVQDGDEIEFRFNV
jgi:GTP-binding protein YchF